MLDLHLVYIETPSLLPCEFDLKKKKKHFCQESSPDFSHSARERLNASLIISFINCNIAINRVEQIPQYSDNISHSPELTFGTIN